MLEDYEESISLTRRTWISRKSSTMQLENWKHQWLQPWMAPAMLCKTCKKNKHGETRGKSDENKSKLACIVEASESTRLHMGESLPTHHEDHNAGKGDNSLQHRNLVHKFIPMPQAMKIPAAKTIVDQEWEKLEKIPAWNLTKVRSKLEVIDEARTKGEKVHFASLMDICHLKNVEVETKHKKIQWSSRTPRRHCERCFWILCSIHWTRVISIANDSSKSHGYHIQTARAHRTSSWCSICLYPGKNGRCSKIVEISQSECPDIWIRLPKHKWPKSWSSMEDPVVPLERNLYGHPLAGPLWERQLEKILLKHYWENVSNWECLFVHREKGLFFSVYVDDIKLAGKKQHIDPMWKVLNKEVDLGEPTAFLDHVNLGCTQRQCEISKDIVDNYRTMFESRISAEWTEKLPCSENLRIFSWS